LAKSRKITYKNINIYQITINYQLFLLYLHPKFNRYGRTSINRIRVALAEQNKTNRWLAEHVGKSEITVSRWVQNKAQPSLEQLLQVAKVLSVSPKDLINDINE
jgi:DNA-binding Xre family transcriptional regulator